MLRSSTHRRREKLTHHPTLTTSTAAVYVDVENVSIEDFEQAFHISGAVGARGKLLQRTQFDLYQREISAQDADHEPLNVQFGDECATTWAELIEQIAAHQSSTPRHRGSLTAPAHAAHPGGIGRRCA